MLLVGAGLFLRTVRNLRQVDVGFETGNLLLIPVNAALNRYEQPRIIALYTSILDELSRLPGIRAATASQLALLSGGEITTGIYVQGRAKPTDHDEINRLAVAPTFFDTMAIPLVAGRGFTDRDTETAPKVAVINEAAVRRYFSHENPIGQRFGQVYEMSNEIEIVGVVRNAKYNSLRDEAPPTMYVPYRQTRLAFMTFALRTAGDPAQSVAAVRSTLRRIDPAIPILRVTTQAEQIEERFAQEKVFAEAYALFGGLAVLIASIGLFGVMSYSVARRTNEIGIRMALGAAREHVVRMVLRESIALIVAGVVIGLVGALAAGRLVASILFGLAPNDPSTIVAAASVLIATAVLASYAPARAASRVDPMIALRSE
jgi:predicted permease